MKTFLTLLFYFVYIGFLLGAAEFFMKEYQAAASILLIFIVLRLLLDMMVSIYLSRQSKKSQYEVVPKLQTPNFKN